MKTCRMENCQKSTKGGANGLCPMHYRRMRLYGDPTIVTRRVTRGTVTERFWQYVHKTETCWLWTGKQHRQGYGELWVDGSMKLAHRISWEIHHEDSKPPLGTMVLHTCDNPPCVNPAHLFLGDQKANMRDMVKKGRCYHGDRRGEFNSASKITEDIVREIRSTNLPPRVYVEKYGISPANVWCIRTRKSWKHVK